MSTPTRSTPTRETPLHIATQYRGKTGMVYELECAGALLDLHVSPRQTSADSGDWHVEARNGHAVDAVAIGRWGSTRAEALHDVGQAWRSTAPALGLSDFDWTAVEKVLSAVNAL